MDIKEAIIHARQVADGCGVDSRDCSYQHYKLVDWLEELVAYRALGPIEELSALVKARDEGRMHIAPISDGTAIFYHIDDDENMFPEVEDGIFEGIYVNGYIEYIFGEMGVDWFLTRAEAEAALGGGGDG